jgi:hypothetical protein
MHIIIFVLTHRVIREPQTTGWGEKYRIRATRYNEAAS